MNGTVVFDFDGTLALGNGPIEAYARAVDAAVGGGFAVRAQQAIEQFETGRSSYRDGYHAVGSLALVEAVDAAILAEAYENSRSLLGTDAAAVSPPEGLGSFLARLSERVRIVLATNAPAEGVVRLLEQWGVAEFFSAAHFRVGKPQGLAAVVDEARHHGPVLAVGDIFDFDLAPAAALGADTALVGVTSSQAPASVTMRGQSLTDLYPEIEAWAAAAASRTAVTSDTEPITERHH